MKTVSGREIIKALERRGWRLARIKGSHHVFVQEGEPARIVVPVHGNRDLAPGTQRDIMRIARLTDEDL
jgi:predicted RNA binding protein YcfA (HicA-like mRNA interferase family)